MLAPILLMLLPLMMTPLGLPMSMMVFGLYALIIHWLRLMIINLMLLELPGCSGMKTHRI